MKPHKHAELIKAWADGAEIQLWWADKWVDSENPNWGGEIYRIKPKLNPEPKKVILYIYNNLIDGKTWVQPHRMFIGHEGTHCTYMGQIEADYVEAKVRGEK
jgi:hypothetical protein